MDECLAADALWHLGFYRNLEDGCALDAILQSSVLGPHSPLSHLSVGCGSGLVADPHHLRPHFLRQPPANHPVSWAAHYHLMSFFSRSLAKDDRS